MEAGMRVYVRRKKGSVRRERKTQRLPEEASETRSPIEEERRRQEHDAMNKGSSSASSAPSDSSPHAAATIKSLLLPNLPDDVALQCIARVPHFYHRDLSLVSKSWHSMLRSPLFFSTRAHLNCTQHLIYVEVHDESFKWFVLEFNPSNPSNPRIVSPGPPISSKVVGSDLAVLGSKIYFLGDYVDGVRCSTVWIFDCRFNRWEIGPSMRVGRASAAVGVLNGKIYVVGGCLYFSARSPDWAEVFDPAVGSWAPIPTPPEVSDSEMEESIPSPRSSPPYAEMEASIFTGEKFYARIDEVEFVFDPCDSSWSNVSSGLLDFDWDEWEGRFCVIDEIFYSCDWSGEIKGFDLKDGIWKELKWVQKDLPVSLLEVRMVNGGGRLYLVWEDKVNKGPGTPTMTEISCAEVEVRKDSNGELWGSVVWSELILVMPPGASLCRCLAVEL